MRATIGRRLAGSRRKKPRSLHAHFLRDDPVSAADAGDPMNGTGYTVCLLDPDGRIYPHERQRRRVVAEARGAAGERLRPRDVLAPGAGKGRLIGTGAADQTASGSSRSDSRRPAVSTSPPSPAVTPSTSTAFYCPRAP